MMMGNINILHVDDDPAVTDLTATFLEREDDRFTVETATGADEGLAVIEEGQVDCVVSAAIPRITEGDLHRKRG